MAFTLYQYNGLSINDGTNYIAVIRSDAPIVPSASPTYVYRPGAYAAYAGAYLQEYTIPIVITIRKADKEAGRKELLQYFAVDDPVKRLLSVKDGSNAQWDWYGKPINVIQESDDLMTVVMALDNPWLVKNAETTDNVAITSTGDDLDMAYTTGNKAAYPRIRIKPTSAKAVGNPYHRHIHLYNGSDSALTEYPVDIVNNGLDTATLVSGGKMQADGDDLRVYVNGTEVDRWLQDMNNATTQVWINLNLSPRAEVILGAAIGAGDTITTVTAASFIDDFPSSGDFLIDSERFTYTSKNDTTKVFSGVTRAVKGTTAADHTTTDYIRWIEHEIIIRYGDATLTAPTVDSGKLPMIALTSTNGVWTYTAFSGAGTRPGDYWTTVTTSGAPTFYTADRNTGSTGIEIGVTGTTTQQGYWLYTHPVSAGIVAWTFTNGEKYATSTSHTVGKIQYDYYGTWTDDYVIPAVSSASTWESWSRTLSSGAVTNRVRMTKQQALNVEVESVAFTLIGYPALVIGAEEEKYYLACTISTGTDSVTINSYPMALNEHLEIDCSLFTVTHVESGSSAINYLSLNDETRMRWLQMPPGVTTTFTYTEAGVAGATMYVYYKPRSTYL